MKILCQNDEIYVSVIGIPDIVVILTRIRAYHYVQIASVSRDLMTSAELLTYKIVMNIFSVVILMA